MPRSNPSITTYIISPKAMITDPDQRKIDAHAAILLLPDSSRIDARAPPTTAVPGALRASASGDARARSGLSRPASAGR